MFATGFGVAGGCRQRKTSPHGPVCGATRHVQASNGTPIAIELGLLLIPSVDMNFLLDWPASEDLGYFRSHPPAHIFSSE